MESFSSQNIMARTAFHLRVLCLGNENVNIIGLTWIKIKGSS